MPQPTCVKISSAFQIGTNEVMWLTQVRAEEIKEEQTDSRRSLCGRELEWKLVALQLGGPSATEAWKAVAGLRKQLQVRASGNETDSSGE